MPNKGPRIISYSIDRKNSKEYYTFNFPAGTLVMPRDAGELLLKFLTEEGYFFHIEAGSFSAIY